MLTIGVSFHLPSIFLSICSWGSFYLSLRHLQPQHKAEWHCRMVTAIHASLITLLSGWSCFVQGPWPFTDAGGLNTPLQVTATIICLGYFLFDFAWCLYFQTEGVPMLLHHSLSILGFVWTLCAGKYGTELMATVCGSEVTNPLLQLRWFLKETGRYDTMLGEVVDALFMISFFAVRLGVGSVLLYTYFQQPTDLMGRFGAVAIYLISWMFWISIFQYAVYKYSKKYHAWRRNHQNEKSENLQSSSSEHSTLAQGDHLQQRRQGGMCEDGVNAEGKCECAGQGDSAFAEVQQNGLRLRSGLHQVCDDKETAGSLSGTLTDNNVTKGVLVNG